MKKDYIFGILILVCILNAFLSYRFFSVNTDYQNCIKTFDLMQKDDFYLYSLDSLQFSSNGKKIQEDFYVENFDGKKLDINSIVAQTSKVAVLRFRESNCLDCNTDLINFWNDFVDAHEIKQSVVFMQFQNPNNFKNFVANQKIKGSLYNSRNYKVNSPLEEQDKPYIFILNAEKQIISPFIVEKSFIERTYRYFGFLNHEFD